MSKYSEDGSAIIPQFYPDGRRRGALIDRHKIPPEKNIEIASLGGKACGEARRRRKTQREILRLILDMKEDDPERQALLKTLGLEGNFAESINYAAVKQATKGDIEAARYVRDTIGEKPREGLEIGNLDDKPLATMDMSKLSDDELKALIARKEETEDVEE